METTKITHRYDEVFNQSSELCNYNLYTSDIALQNELDNYQAIWGKDSISKHGEKVGRKESILLGFQANANKPIFHSHDRFGHRIDEVEYHPAYHQLMKIGVEEGIPSDAWNYPKKGAHVVRAAKKYLQAQLEPGHGCPLTMTAAVVPALRLTPEIAKDWVPKILTKVYDPRNVPYFEKKGLTFGMGMTERQGGSDVQANTTIAKPISTVTGEGQLYKLTGHKWFLSAPMSDAFLMLAKANEGLSCFLVPRWQPDGKKNPVEIQRLKDKMGNYSNASSEVEIRGAIGWMIGQPGQGVRTIIEMVSMTRFDCMIGSTALQRQAVVQAIHHCRERSVFGKLLIKQPLMKNVLADLHLEELGSLALTMKMASTLDNLEDSYQRNLKRLGLAVGKYWICKRTPLLTYEAMECLGGNGVMEECIMPRLYREAPINAIWEGSGNVQALDILRAINKKPEILEVWLKEVNLVDHPVLKRETNSIKKLVSSTDIEFRARELTESLALTMQASLLLRNDEKIGELFVQSRLGNRFHAHFGCLSSKENLDQFLEDALRL